MIKKCFQIILCLWMTIASTYSVGGKSIKIVTEEFPPYSYSKNGQLTGVATEVVKAVLKQLKMSDEILVYPWARAYKIALNEKNVLIFGINRTSDRENLFKWVGFIASNNLAFFSLQQRNDIKVNSLNDAKKYEIGLILADFGEQYLLSKHFTHISAVTNDLQNLKKLLNGRIDLWLTDEHNGYYVLKENDQNPKNFKIVYDFKVSSGLYMAFSKKTPDVIVEEFKQALETIKANGTYTKIVQKYK